MQYHKVLPVVEFEKKMLKICLSLVTKWPSHSPQDARQLRMNKLESLFPAIEIEDVVKFTDNAGNRMTIGHRAFRAT